MAEFITAGIATILKYVEAHPVHVREACLIFPPVTGRTRTQDMLCAADQSILEEIKRW
jgi:hypothetical protein